MIMPNKHIKSVKATLMKSKIKPKCDTTTYHTEWLKFKIVSVKC